MSEPPLRIEFLHPELGICVLLSPRGTSNASLQVVSNALGDQCCSRIADTFAHSRKLHPTARLLSDTESPYDFYFVDVHAIPSSPD
jgi:hypothetical protein